MNSWIQIPKDSDFTIANIPFGIGTSKDWSAAVCTRVGDTIINLDLLYDAGDFSKLGIPRSALANKVLNDFIALGKKVTIPFRTYLQDQFVNEEAALKEVPQAFKKSEEVTMLLPLRIGDYTDFYSSIEHATNVGKMFRDPANALLPNWLHLPVGYHGRSSSIVVSGTPIKRPYGQLKPNEGPPVEGFSQRVDIELEMAFVIGKSTALGTRIPTSQSMEHIFGMLLFNDWSARDIQKWEYVPLGPFLGKNFGSTISPWIVTMEALAPFATEGPAPIEPLLPYLQTSGKYNYDIQLEVDLTASGSTTTICKSNFKYMYWSMVQQLAHHTVNGCNVNIGDLIASGTISGPEEGSYGSMLELSWGGQRPITLSDGDERKFLKDGDSVTLRGWAGQGDKRVGFGEAEGTIIS